MLNKLTTTLFALILTITCAMAQAPTQVNYQGVARDANGNAIASQTIKVRFKIRHNTSTGTVQYQETRTLTTSATGLFTAQIGGPGGNSIIGSMSAVTWDAGTKYLQVEMDTAGGSSFTNMGAQLLVSVPYALQATKANSSQYADSAAALKSNAVVKLSNLETTNASANQVLQFDGTAWQPTDVYDGLMLPYNVADPNLVSFAITNTSALGGSAVYGRTTTNTATATGVRGESTAASGNGVYGKANGATSFGVLGENTSGYGIKGTTAGSNMAGVFGNNTGTTGSGVLGTANFSSGYGVQGSSTTGTGVYGYSNTGVGVSANTVWGTALKGVSGSGYGLDVSGNVKISGGNTSPGAGKVLTSDASGNATWQNLSKVAFYAGGASASIPNGAVTLAGYSTEVFDVGNNYNTGTHKFTAPVSGYYHFDVNASMGIVSQVYNITLSEIILMKYSNGVETWESEVTGYTRSDALSSVATCQVNTTLHLLAGDQVYVKLDQSNGGNLGTNTNWSTTDNYYFSGHLLFVD